MTPRTPAVDYRQIAERAPVGLAEIDDGMLVAANARWLDMLPGPGALPVGTEDAFSAVVPTDADELCRMLLDPTARAEGFMIEVRTTTVPPRHLRIRGESLRRDRATFACSVADITELEAARRSRLEQDERYRQLLRDSPVGQAIYDRRGTMVEVNRAWADLLGYEPDEVVGAQATAFVHPEDRPGLDPLVEQLVGGSIPHIRAERRLLHRDGSAVWVDSSIALERDEDGRPVRFHSLVIDISDRRSAEDDLRRSEHRYRRLIDQAPVPQLISELDGTLIEVNQAFCSLMGASAEELLALPPARIVHAEDWVRLDAELRRLLDGEATFFDSVRRLVRPDGTIVWVSGGTALVDDDGRPVLHSVMQDVTEQRAAEEALRASEDKYRTLVTAAPIGYILVDGDGSVLQANPAVCEIFGVSQSEVLRIEPFSLCHPDDKAHLLDLVGELLDGERTTFAVDHRLVRPHGGVRWVHTVVSRTGSVEDPVPSFVVLIRDITSRMEAELALRHSEDLFRSLAENLPVGIYRTDAKGRITYTNPRWTDITAMTEEEQQTSYRLGRIHPDDRDGFRSAIEQATLARTPFHLQYRIVGHDGVVSWLNTRGVALFDERDELEGYIGSVEDITPLIDAQERSNQLARIVETTSDLVGVSDHPSGALRFLNLAARHHFAISEHDDLAGLNIRDLYTEDSVIRFTDEILPVLDGGGSWSGELTMVSTTGERIDVWQTIAAERDPSGDIIHLSSVGRDVTERRRLESQLAYAATHDPLTDLPNRALLIDHLELALAQAERQDHVVGVLFMDLDRFKLVNDTMGHEAGDELLRQAARRIAQVLRPGDTVARLGGDEFVVLCTQVVDEHQALAIAQRVASCLEGDTFRIEGAEVVVSASIGVALSSPTRTHPEGLLRDADAAMYRAKDLGRARIELFDETMRQRAVERQRLADELARAVELDEIRVVYQPAFDLKTGRAICVEALARWEHPTRGLLQPSDFIGLAEDSGLIVGLGLRVLTLACHQTARWQRELGEKTPVMHVNLSASQLDTPNLATLVAGVLESSGLDPCLLCLEVTESVVMNDAARAITTLQALKDLGIRLAIDDFGTGYSSLSYLRRLPVDTLKIDRSFIDGLGPEDDDTTIVAAIVRLAHTLELETIAEGVETTEQLGRLQELGCTGAQGFLFAYPEPAMTAYKLLRDEVDV